MPQTLFEKIAGPHLVAGTLMPGEEIALRIDQTLTQDSLGAMAYLQFEAIGKPKVATELSVSYTDHLMMQSGEGNADVHRYLATVADQIGALYSKPGNGICHQVHLERFSHPGKTLIGGDSHTVTCGAVGMLALGVGGLDVALAMAGYPYYITCPGITHVLLEGSLPPWVTAKDIALAILRELTSKGNVGTVLEYGGSALGELTVPQRATIANMGAETGVSTSIFPSDEMTRRFLASQGREDAWIPLEADSGAPYQQELVIDLSALEPLVALPHSPDRVERVRDVGGLQVDQVLIGSCTNSSYQDLMRAAHVLRGRRVAPHVSLGIAPGSRQVLSMLAQAGVLTWMIEAGARILESGCGFCVGHGQAPRLGGVSVRTSNRNYKGRSGTQDAQVYLVSPETAAETAVRGYLTDPRESGLEYPDIAMPDHMNIDDTMILQPTGSREIYRSRLIGSPPVNTPMPREFTGTVAIKLGDNINTDDIIPAGPAMTFRANVQKSCAFVFQYIDAQFPKTCGSVLARNEIPLIVAGESYGQGSSREHAALCPMTMGVRCVVAKSFERIHMANLMNFGILPLTFRDIADYDDIDAEDQLRIGNIQQQVMEETLIVQNTTKKTQYRLTNNANPRQRRIIAAGGLLNTVQNAKEDAVR